MVEAQGKMQTEKVIAYMIIAGLIGFLIDTIMVFAEKVLLRWTRLPVIDSHKIKRIDVIQ